MDEEVYIMVIGYNSFDDEFGTVLDIVKTEEEVKEYNNNFVYNDLVDCLKYENVYVFEDQEYSVGDKFIFD